MIAAVRQLGQLLAHRRDKALVCEDQSAFVRHQIAQSVNRLAEHRRFAHQLQQLLRRVVAAGRPESRAGAAGHDDSVKHGKVKS